MTILAVFLVVVGSLLILLASVGVLRFPDVFTRANAATKAAGLGVACVLFGTAFWIGTWEAGLKLGFAALLQFATAPISGHLMGRAAYRSGAPLSPMTHIDDLAVPDDAQQHGADRRLATEAHAGRQAAQDSDRRSGTAGA